MIAQNLDVNKRTAFTGKSLQMWAEKHTIFS